MPWASSTSDAPFPSQAVANCLRSAARELARSFALNTCTRAFADQILARLTRKEETTHPTTTKQELTGCRGACPCTPPAPDSGRFPPPGPTATASRPHLGRPAASVAAGLAASRLSVQNGTWWEFLRMEPFWLVFQGRPT